MAATRLLLPPEHGAWAQLLFPLVTALSLPDAGVQAWLLALAVLCAFLASESLRVLAGSRGSRVARELAPAARRSLLVLLVGALVASATVLVTATVPVRWATAVLAAVSASVWLHALRGGLKTTWGELHVTTALSCWATPVALAAGAPLAWAVTMPCAWTAAFAAATLAVRSVTARGFRRPFRHYQAAAIALALSAAVALSALARADALHPLVVFTFLPTAAVVLLVAIVVPPTRWLKHIGWAVVVTSVILLAGLILAGRTG